MISTKNVVSDESKVPSAWVFQYYLDLPESLTGQNVRIHSIFNPGERTPSMWVFVDKNSINLRISQQETMVTKLI